MENSIEVPQKVKSRTTIWLPIPLLGIYSRKYNHDQRDICIPMFTVALFTIASIWKHPNKKLYVCNHEKERNPVICHNMDRPWGHYVKWNKSKRERHTLYDITCMWNLKKQNSQKRRIEKWLPGVEGWENWGDVSQRIQTFSYKVSKFWNWGVDRAISH